MRKLVANTHLHHELVQALLAGVAGCLLGCLQLALVLRQHALHLWLQPLLSHPHALSLGSCLLKPDESRATQNNTQQVRMSAAP